MKLLYVLLADHAFLSIDKKVNIIGVFENINAAKFPVTHPKFVVVGSVDSPKPKFKMSVVLADKEGKALMGGNNEREISLPQDSLTRNFNFIIEVINASFSKSGEYSVKILIDGKSIGEQTLHVLESSSPQTISLSDLKPS
ncbi:MAG: hypothetical protein WD231_05025 [Candidatus Woykebacteria bacterium]